MDNDARLNQLMAWLEEHFAEEVCWEGWRNVSRSLCVPCTASSNIAPA